MTERVDFYILKSAAPKQRLAFACRLTEKAYLRDLSIVILNESLADAKVLDEMLWTFNERSFVPHKVSVDEASFDPRTPVHLIVESTPAPAADLLINLALRLPGAGANVLTDRGNRGRGRGAAPTGTRALQSLP